ncbi:MAG TPA: short-chain dehydrogenase [Chloroflexi bacterium]|nr:short-chain dehydrogenase [Chloroflexota bacterium]
MNKWTTTNIPDLSNKTAIVTGANSGIGYWAAYWMAAQGARVVIASRNAQKADSAVKKMGASQPGLELDLIPLDLANLETIRDFVAVFQERYTSLDILVNNAGVMALPYRQTADGFEMQFGTNHLGHFALTGLLLPRLLASPAGRVVTISSMVHRQGSIDFGNLNGEKAYAPWPAYRQSKLSNLLFAYELQRKLQAAGKPLISLACHPGYANTNLQSVGPEMGQSSLDKLFWKLANTLVAQSAEKGALPSLYAATALEAQGGDFIAPHGPAEARGYPVRSKSSPASYEEAAAAKLWQISEELTGVKYPLTADR